MGPEIERSRYWTYLIVALIGMLAGMALGQLGAVREPGHSRVDWPSSSPAPAPTPPHPRSLQP